MHGLILATTDEGGLERGESRVPALFFEVQGKTLYEWQLDTLAAVCDEITVVLGHGFVDCADGGAVPATATGTFDGDIRVRQNGFIDPPPDIHEEKVRAHLATDHDVVVNAVVVPHWEGMGSAEYCRLGLRETAGHVLIVDGNLLYRDYLIKTLVAEYETRFAGDGWTVIGVTPIERTERHSVAWDGEGRIAAYGEVHGHRTVGISMLHSRHTDAASALLQSHRHDEYPAVLPAIETTYLPVPPESHFSIETPKELVDAKSTVDEWATEGPRTPSFSR